MKIYTKTGDQGMTSLIGGERVFKTDPRVEAYGTVDELMAFTALLSDRMRDDERLSDCTRMLDAVNSHLMTVSALLAVGDGGEGKVPPLKESSVSMLEEEIDRMTATLEPIGKFTIPGGNAIVSQCHVCRTVCRRAERAALRASALHPADPTALRYLNRLSDLFYTLGRTLNRRLCVEEILWIP